MSPLTRRPTQIKHLLVFLLPACLLAAAIFWASPPAGSASTAAQAPTPGPGLVVQPTPTLHPIPELNPNPRQTDGVILGAAVILAVITAGVWTYGRKRKE